MSEHLGGIHISYDTRHFFHARIASISTTPVFRDGEFANNGDIPSISRFQTLYAISDDPSSDKVHQEDIRAMARIERFLAKVERRFEVFGEIGRNHSVRNGELSVSYHMFRTMIAPHEKLRIFSIVRAFP
jgi:hypothetical protein